MSDEFPCGRDYHGFRIWFKCEGCNVEKTFTFNRRCQSDDISISGFPMQIKKFYCARCNYRDQALRMIFYCEKKGWDHDEKGVRHDGKTFLLRIHVDNIDHED